MAASGALHLVLSTTSALFALDGLLVANAAVMWALLVSVGRRTTTQNVVLIAVAQWGFSLVAVIIEPWAIHFTPMICLGAVLSSVGLMDRNQYQTFSLAAIGFIATMTIVGRIERYGPIMDESPGWLRNVIAVILTPLLFVLVSWICWESHNAIWSRNRLILQSQRRLLDAEEIGRQAIERESADLRRRLASFRDRLALPDGAGSIDPRATAAGLLSEVQRASSDLRQLSHGVLPPALRGSSPEPALHAVAGLASW
ncbi:MAG: hypothetical protein ACR2QK_12455, partial [Acidimicrobiales bacterium]